mgnify:FL=1
MKTLLTLLLSISLSNIAYANGVYITQAGDDLTVNISQDGRNNTITKNIWTVAYDWEGDNNTFDLRQKNTRNNSSDSNYQGFHIDGNNNTVRVGQGFGDYGNLATAATQEWDTDNSEGGNNTAMVDIHGDNNILNIGQRNGSLGTFNGHDVTAYIYGDDNTARTVQVHDGAKDLTLTLIGDDHTVYVEQKSTGAHNATISLTNGTNPYSLSLSQNSTTAQSYSMSGTCYTAGGCSVSVTQD